MFTARPDPRKTTSSRAPGARDRQVRPSLTKSVVANETQVAFPHATSYLAPKTPDRAATCGKQGVHRPSVAVAGTRPSVPDCRFSQNYVNLDRGSLRPYGGSAEL